MFDKIHKALPWITSLEEVVYPLLGLMIAIEFFEVKVKNLFPLPFRRFFGMPESKNSQKLPKSVFEHEIVVELINILVKPNLAGRLVVIHRSVKLTLGEESEA